MRLDDLRKSKSRDEVGSIPAEVERELEILDAALRGEEIPAGMEGIEALVSDMKAERPEPEPRFEAELDAWAAAGFPRGKRPGALARGGGSGASKGGVFGRFGSGGSRGWAPVAATAAVVVVVGVSLSQLGDFSNDDSTGGDTAAVDAGGDVSSSDDSGGSSAEIQVEPTAPATDEASEEGEASLPGVLEDAGGNDSIEAGLSQNNQGFTRDQDAGYQSSRANLGTGGVEADDRSGGANRGQEKRQVERDAQITLAAPADEIPDVNDEVIGVIEGANGVIDNAQLIEREDSARATLDVRVPSATLDDTLAALSELANVQSRADQSQDITRVYVSAKDRLVGLRAERDNLATRIREADTDEEVAALQASLTKVNEAIADAKTDLNEVETRASLADLTIVITSEGAGASDDDDGWSFGDALDDAGKVLEVGAGVALISAAVLLPLAIIAAIAFFVISAANRRARERALDK